MINTIVEKAKYYLSNKSCYDRNKSEDGNCYGYEIKNCCIKNCCMECEYLTKNTEEGETPAVVQ